MKPGIYDNISNKDYHADKESFSSSLIKMMDVPAEAKYKLDNPGEYKECYRMGSAIHSFTLEREKFNSEFLTGIDCERRSAADRHKWAQWFCEHGADGERITSNSSKVWHAMFEAETGKHMVTPSEIEKIRLMSEAVFSHHAASSVLNNGAAEQSLYCCDSETRINLRARPDFLGNEIVDLKSIERIDDRSIWNQTRNLGYHISAAMYQDIHYQLTKDYKRFVFVFVCKSPPYLTRVLTMPDSLAEEGHRMYRLGVSRLARCLESGEWPGYSQNIDVMTNPYEKATLDWGE
jgi:hypothetical protein